MKKEKAELIQEALDTLQAVTLSGRSTEGYVAELFEDIRNLEEENKKLREENEHRKKIADVLPEGDGHIAEETIQDLQKEIKLLKMSLEEKDENCYSLARENEQLKLHVEAKDKAYMSLLTDYNYLQARIKRMEKAFLEYVESHKKLEDELDDVIMNR